MEFNSDGLEKRCSNQHFDHRRNNGHTIVDANEFREFLLCVKSQNKNYKIPNVFITHSQVDETRATLPLVVENGAPFSMLGIALENLELQISGGSLFCLS